MSDILRDDVSDKLVHLTKGTGLDSAKHRHEAAMVLASILSEQRLIGGTGYIKGSYRCVCFSEAPIGKLSHILAAKADSTFKYQPYGVMVSKHWLYSKGGLPVIYGPDGDYNELPQSMKYRHVRLYLGDYTVDHSWEREWRVSTDSLFITPEDVTVIVPNRDAKDEFTSNGYEQWHYIALSDLGVQIATL